MKPFEQAVASLNNVDSVIGLADILPQLKAGLSDVAKRIETLEAQVAALKATIVTH